MAANAQLRLTLKNAIKDAMARFGTPLSVVVEADGAGVTGKTEGQEQVFTFPAAATSLRLLVTIDAVDGAGARAVGATLKLEQKLALDLTSKKPTVTPAGPAPFTAALDPRFELLALAQGGAVLRATVDLRAMDVTTHLRLRKNLGMVVYDKTPGLFVGALGPHYGMELHAIELTTKPALWFVLVHPKARTTARPGALVFFRPRGAAYANADDAMVRMLGGFTRYMFDPQKNEPWHVHPTSIDQFPPCGLERQLGEADRPLVFVFPMPDDGGFGNASGANLLPHLNMVLATLATSPSAASGTALGNGVTEPVRRGRLGLAGFSFGGAACLTTFKANSGSVDELYLMDPANMKDSEGISSWWLGKDKRLGLLGGVFFLGQFRLMAAALQKLKDKDAKITSEVILLPKDGAARGVTVDGFEDSNVYPFALMMPGSSPARFQDQFELEPDGTPKLDAAKKPILTPSPAKNTLSANSGIFFVRFKDVGGFTQTTIGGRDASGKPFEVTVDRSSLTELSARAQLLWAPPPPGAPFSPLTTAKDMAQWARNDLIFLQDTDFSIKIEVNPKVGVVGTIRHQWPVVGGSGGIDRGAGFKGYLRQCLDKSLF
jgi:hypothetical protein